MMNREGDDGGDGRGRPTRGITKELTEMRRKRPSHTYSKKKCAWSSSEEGRDKNRWRPFCYSCNSVGVWGEAGGKKRIGGGHVVAAIQDAIYVETNGGRTVPGASLHGTVGQDVL